MGWLKCGLTVFEKDLCGWRSDCLREADLFAVVGGVLHADQVSVGPSVQVCVLSADVSVASVARFALAAEHGVGEMSQVVAACVFVAVVASVEAGITGRAHLRGRRSTNQRSHRFSMVTNSWHRFLTTPDVHRDERPGAMQVTPYTASVISIYFFYRTSQGLVALPVRALAFFLKTELACLFAAACSTPLPKGWGPE